jgi:hypothetical protein
MHIRCKTEVAIILLGVADETGFLFYPTTAPETPGLMFSPSVSEPINLQITDLCGEFLGTKLDGFTLDICQKYSDKVNLTDNRIATLYLATVRNHEKLIQNDWSNLPDQIKAMPKNRNRLAYLRAWQVMTGSLSLTTKAVEIDDLSTIHD